MRYRTAATALVLSLSLSALSTLAAPTDLRGPAPQAGHTLFTNVETETEQGEIKGFMMGNPVQGTMSTKSKQLIQQTVLELADGLPSKVQQRYVEAVTTNDMVFNGFEQSQEQKEMQGVVLTMTRDGEAWDTAVEGGEVPEQLQAMVENITYAEPRLAYPEEAVEVGHKWKVEDDDLAAAIGMTGFPGAEYDGDVSYELIEVKEVDGRQYAVITYKMDVTMTMRLQPQGNEMEITMDMKGEGLIERDLTDFTDTNVFEGEMEFGMEFSANGQPMGQMDAEMVMTSTSVQTLKK